MEKKTDVGKTKRGKEEKRMKKRRRSKIQRNAKGNLKANSLSAPKAAVH